MHGSNGTKLALSGLLEFETNCSPRVAKRGFRFKRFADYPSLRVTSWGRVVTFASDSNDARVSVIGVSEADSNGSTLSALSMRLTELQLSEDYIAATKGVTVYAFCQRLWCWRSESTHRKGRFPTHKMYTRSGDFVATCDLTLCPAAKFHGFRVRWRSRRTDGAKHSRVDSLRSTRIESG